MIKGDGRPGIYVPALLHKRETRAVLAHVLEASLRALHPHAPFVTEELWQRLPKPPERPVSIALAAYPGVADGRIDEPAEADVARLIATIGAARAIRTEYTLHPAAKVPLVLRTNQPNALRLLDSQRRAIAVLVKTEGEIVIENAGGERLMGYVRRWPGKSRSWLVEGLVEADKERTRITRSLAKLEKEQAALEKRLENPKFREKARPELVLEVANQITTLQEQRSRLGEAQRLVDEF